MTSPPQEPDHNKTKGADERQTAPSLRDPYSMRLDQLLFSAQLSDTKDAVPAAVDESDSLHVRSLRETLLSRIERTSGFPALPAIVSRLDDLVSNPHVDATAIAKVLLLDPGLASQLLCLVNSALFGLKHEVRRMEQAVALVGVDSIRTLVFTTSLIKVLGAAPAPPFDLVRFWEHSLTTAIAGKRIAKSLVGTLPGPVDEEDAFLAGLMHDIGKIVIAQHFTAEAEVIATVAREERLSQYDAELIVLGIRHTDVGHRLLDRWGLPAALTNAVRYHHEPGAGGRLAWVVHFADRISRGLGFHPDAAEMPRFDPLAWTELALSDHVVQSIGRDVLSSFDDTRKLLFRARADGSA